MTAFAIQSLTDGASRLIVDGDMSIYNALEVKEHLINAVRGAKTLELDLSHVVEMDTAGFQLLILAKQESLRLGLIVRITAHSDAVRELIDFYNMGSFFGDPVVILAQDKE
jgi:anti-anti-sigma factor